MAVDAMAPCVARTSAAMALTMNKISQYYGRWCPDSLRRQAISSHGIDYAG